MKKNACKILLALITLCAGSVIGDNINGVDIDFVDIGYAGNSADSTGYGAVNYDYRIGKYEITSSQFEASGVGNAASQDSWGAAGPVSRVSWNEAAQFCNWLTTGFTNQGAYAISTGGAVSGIDRAAAVSAYGTVYVMPTEDEWYKAAYYKGASDSYNLYATADGLQPSTSEANYNASSAWAIGSASQDELNGTQDMMGNVWEHTETLDGGAPVYYGGSYGLNETAMLSTERALGDTTGEYLSVGVRIAAIPEPATMSFMGLSTIGLFITRTVRRRRRLGSSVLPAIRRTPRCDMFTDENDVQCVDETVTEVEAYGLWSLFKDVSIKIGMVVRDAYQIVDKAFWNRMVSAHEQRLIKHRAFRDNFKRKALSGFDDFLALIMK